MNGNRMENINFSVCVEWGYDENNVPYCYGWLNKLAPEDKKEAYERDGFNFVGACGGEGTEYYCYATASEAVKNAHFNPFMLKYCGEFTNEEVHELQLAIREMYDAGRLKDYKTEQYRITQEMVDNFASDFPKYKVE